MNLPDKSLKDYYQLIEEPMSLKKLWRAIKGMHGRGGATGVSHFKSWVALEEKSSLLWNNAFYYNEEGSEIYELAQELKVSQKKKKQPKKITSPHMDMSNPASFSPRTRSTSN